MGDGGNGGIWHLQVEQVLQIQGKRFLSSLWACVCSTGRLEVTGSSSAGGCSGQFWRKPGMRSLYGYSHSPTSASWWQWCVQECSACMKWLSPLTVVHVSQSREEMATNVAPALMLMIHSHSSFHGALSDSVFGDWGEVFADQFNSFSLQWGSFGESLIEENTVMIPFKA